MRGGSMFPNSLEAINYQNLIGRSPKAMLFSKDELQVLGQERFFVTGAGGSIGSRIVNLIASIPGAKFLATDRDETALHSLSLNLTTTALFETDQFELLDIRDLHGITQSLERFRPTVVIHAAALKHLSVLQRQPREATLTNVFGSANMIESALKIGVSKLINISTDKAAKPVSVLGKSKHLAELYTSKTGSQNDVTYTSCRFGNVFNSRGSVIETFLRQMTTGAPVTLTHPDISRYFMHTDEAAYLTLKSLLIKEGHVHVFNMGEPILLLDIIANMQRLLGTNSQILLTGLREGEKLRENLFDTSDAHKLQDLHQEIFSVDFSAGNFEESRLFMDAIADRNEELVTKFLANPT